MILLSEEDVLNTIALVIDDREVRLALKCMMMEINLLHMTTRPTGEFTQSIRSYNKGRISLMEVARHIITGQGSKMSRALLVYSILRLTIPEKKWRVYVTDDEDIVPFVLSTYRSEDYLVLLSTDNIDSITRSIRRGQYTKICSAEEAMDVTAGEYRDYGYYTEDRARDTAEDEYGRVEFLDRIDEIEKEASVPEADVRAIVMPAVLALKEQYPIIRYDHLCKTIFFTVTARRILRAYRKLFNSINPCSSTPGMSVPTHPMFSGF
jgi:hypothetical protein